MRGRGDHRNRAARGLAVAGRSPVEQLRDGLWSIPVPMLGPLRYVNVHAFALDGGGLGLIDAGWESEEGWTALTDGLAAIGGGVEDVRGLLVTHLHFDHLGLAERVRQASGAWVAMHPADAAVVASPRTGTRPPSPPRRSSSWCRSAPTGTTRCPTSGRSSG